MMHKLLVVDDQADLRLLIALTFRDSDFAVREAGDVQAALAECRADVPDVILVDVMMPGGDGYTLIKALRGDLRFLNTVVVLTTAGDQAAERARAEEAGVDYYLPKPFAPSQLPALLSRLLAVKRETPL